MLVIDAIRAFCHGMEANDKILYKIKVLKQKNTILRQSLLPSAVAHKRGSKVFARVFLLFIRQNKTFVSDNF